MLAHGVALWGKSCLVLTSNRYSCKVRTNCLLNDIAESAQDWILTRRTAYFAVVTCREFLLPDFMVPDFMVPVSKSLDSNLFSQQRDAKLPVRRWPSPWPAVCAGPASSFPIQFHLPLTTYHNQIINSIPWEHSQWQLICPLSSHSHYSPLNREIICGLMSGTTLFYNVHRHSFMHVLFNDDST